MKPVICPAYSHGMRLIVLIIMTAALMPLSACALKKAYSGPHLDYDKIAIIQPDTQKAFTEIKIVSIDKYKLNFFESKAEVWPGVHTMFVDVKLDFPYLDHPLGFSQYISFKADPGRIYTIQAKIDTVKNEGFLWVTSDNGADPFVGGAMVGPVKLLPANK